MSNRQFGVLRAGFDELNLDLDALNRSLDARRLTGFRSRGFQINSLTLYHYDMDKYRSAIRTFPFLHRAARTRVGIGHVR